MGLQQEGNRYSGIYGLARAIGETNPERVNWGALPGITHLGKALNIATGALYRLDRGCGGTDPFPCGVAGVSSEKAQEILRGEG
jgi:hypothetical protein